MESGIWNRLDGIWNLESGISNLQSSICNPESGIWNLESGIWNLESARWNLESAICSSSMACGPAALGYLATCPLEGALARRVQAHRKRLRVSAYRLSGALEPPSTTTIK